MAARKGKAPAPRPASPRDLPVVQPDAAGIDVGSAEHCVAVPTDRDPVPVRRFAAFTADLDRRADWLAVSLSAAERTGLSYRALCPLLPLLPSTTT